MRNKIYVRKSKETNLRNILGFVESISFLRMIENSTIFKIFDRLHSLGFEANDIIRGGKEYFVFQNNKGKIYFEKQNWYDDLGTANVPSYTSYIFSHCELKKED